MNTPQSDQEICESAKRTLLEMDVDGDGKVSVEEFRQKWQAHHAAEDLDRLMTMMDRNGNGYIDVGETLLRLDGSPFCA